MLEIKDEAQYQQGKRLLTGTDFAKANPEKAKQLGGALKAYSDKIDREEWEAAKDMTPTEYKPSPMSGPSINSLAAGIPNRKDNRPALAAAGVDLVSGLDSIERLQLGMVGHDPEVGTQTLDWIARKRLDAAGIRVPEGQPAIVRVEDTGELAYWRPYKDEEGNVRTKLTLANEAGITGKDVVANLPGTVSLVAELGTELATTAAATLATGGNVPAGVVAGAAAAGGTNFAVHRARRHLATALGIPKEIADELSTVDDLERAGMAAGYSLLLPAIVGTWKGLGNMRRPIDFGDKKSIEEAQEFIGQSVLKIRALEQATGQQFRLSAAAISGSPQLLVQEGASVRRVVGKRSMEANENLLRNNRSAVNAVSAINDAVVRYDPTFVGPSEAAERAQKIVRQPLDDLTQEGVEKRVEQEVLNQTVDGTYKPSVYQGLQTDLADRHEAVRKANTGNWQAFRAAIGWDPVKKTADVHVANPPNTRLRKALTGLDRDGQLALSESAQRATDSMLEDLGLPPIPEKYKGTRGNLIGQGLAGETLDLNQLHKLSSQLKAELRAVGSRNGMGWKANDLQELIGVLDDTIRTGKLVRTSTKKPLDVAEQANVRSSFAEAIDGSKRYHEVWDDIAKASVFATENGRFKMAPGALRKLLFAPGDAGSIRKVMGISGGDPNTRAAIAGEIESLYKSQVMAGGEWSETAHAAFMNNMQDHMLETFGEAGSDFIRRTGNIGTAVKAIDNQAKQVRLALQHAYGKRLTDEQMYAGNVARDALRGELSTKQIDNLRMALTGTENPEGVKLWANIQRSGLDAIEQEFLKKSGNAVNSRAIDQLVTNHAERLTAFYGPQYVENLGTLRSVLTMLERDSIAGNIRRDPQPMWLAVARSYLGPMDKKQRRITAVNKLARRLSDDRLAEILKDESLLHGLVKHDKMSLQVQQALKSAGTGLATMLNDEEEVP